MLRAQDDVAVVRRVPSEPDSWTRLLVNLSHFVTLLQIVGFQALLVYAFPVADRVRCKLPARTGLGHVDLAGCTIPVMRLVGHRPHGEPSYHHRRARRREAPQLVTSQHHDSF
jgi:hypothetical protein